MLRSIDAANAAISVATLLLATLARLASRPHGAVELLVVLHGVLEHADRARQRADLVAARADRERRHRVALGDLFGDARDLGERTRPRRARGSARRRAASRTASTPSKLISHAVEVDAGVDLGIECLAPARRIARASISRSLFSAMRTVRLASLSPHSRPAAWPTSTPSRASSLRNSMELPDALGERLELRGVVRPHRALPRR